MTDEKTFADVADKLVDKLSGGVDHLAQAVNKIAPHAWELAVRQTRYEAGLSLMQDALAGLSTPPSPCSRP